MDESTQIMNAYPSTSIINRNRLQQILGVKKSMAQPVEAEMLKHP